MSLVTPPAVPCSTSTATPSGVLPAFARRSSDNIYTTRAFVRSPQTARASSTVRSPRTPRSSSVARSSPSSRVRPPSPQPRNTKPRATVLPHLFAPCSPSVRAQASPVPQFPMSVATFSTPQRATRISRRAASADAFNSLSPQPIQQYSRPLRERLAVTPGRRACRQVESPERGALGPAPRLSRTFESGSPGWRSAEKKDDEQWDEREDAKAVDYDSVLPRLDEPSPRVPTKSSLPTGKLNGWAHVENNEAWSDNNSKSPASELGSDHMTCSTQWSVSQFSGASGSTNSNAGEDRSFVNGKCCPWESLAKDLVPSTLLLPAFKVAW